MWGDLTCVRKFCSSCNAVSHHWTNPNLIWQAGGVACTMNLLKNSKTRGDAVSWMEHLLWDSDLSDDRLEEAEQMMLDMGAARLVADTLRPRYVQQEEVEASIGVLHIASLYSDAVV